MEPRKVILAVLITGILIAASVGAVFITADRAGMITASVRVSGNAQGSNATQCHLYVDGEKVKTTSLGSGGYYDYDYYYSNRYYSFNVDVKANREHEFQVITSEGEESESVVENVPFGRSTYVSLNIVMKMVDVIVRGNYTGNRSSVGITLYVNNNYEGYMTVNNMGSSQFIFSTEQFGNRLCTFKLEAKLTSYPNTILSTNQTAVYLGSSLATIYMDVGVES